MGSMPGDNRVSAIAALLDQAEAAHGVYERGELAGVYDEQWPAWYAGFVVEHGLGEVLGHPVTTEALTALLTRGWHELKSAEAKPRDSWATWTAARIAAEL
jgi:hypothetical protein